MLQPVRKRQSLGKRHYEKSWSWEVELWGVTGPGVKLPFRGGGLAETARVTGTPATCFRSKEMGQGRNFWAHHPAY